MDIKYLFNGFNYNDHEYDSRHRAMFDITSNYFFFKLPNAGMTLEEEMCDNAVLPLMTLNNKIDSLF